MRWFSLRTLVGGALGVSGLVACGAFSTSPADSSDAETEASAPSPSASSSASNEAGSPEASAIVDATPSVDAEARVFRAFVTSETTPGKFTNGVAGADLFCAMSARTSLPGRKWKAYLALQNVPPRARIVQVPRGWFDAQGTLVADVPTKLDAPLDNPPKFDANGIAVTGKAWTGVRGGVARMTCDSWTGAGMGDYGDIGNKSSWFASGADDGCATRSHLYCFEQP